MVSQVYYVNHYDFSDIEKRKDIFLNQFGKRLLKIQSNRYKYVFNIKWRLDVHRCIMYH